MRSQTNYKTGSLLKMKGGTISTVTNLSQIYDVINESIEVISAFKKFTELIQFVLGLSYHPMY